MNTNFKKLSVLALAAAAVAFTAPSFAQTRGGVVAGGGSGRSIGGSRSIIGSGSIPSGAGRSTYTVERYESGNRSLGNRGGRGAGYRGSSGRSTFEDVVIDPDNANIARNNNQLQNRTSRSTVTVEPKVEYHTNQLGNYYRTERIETRTDTERFRDEPLLYYNMNGRGRGGRHGVVRLPAGRVITNSSEVISVEKAPLPGTTNMARYVRPDGSVFYQRLETEQGWVPRRFSID